MYRTGNLNDSLSQEMKALVKAFEDGTLEPLIFESPAGEIQPSIIYTDDEYGKRLRAVDETRADLQFDELIWDDAMERLNQRFVDAELDLDQYIEAVKSLAANDPNRDRATAEARLTGMRMVELHFRPV